MSISIWPHTLLYSRKAKNGTFARIKNELDPQTHINLESMSPGNVISISIWSHPFLYSKKPKMVLLPEKEWSYRPKTLACRHNLTANNMGWIPSGHTSSSSYVRLKMSKMVFPK